MFRHPGQDRSPIATPCIGGAYLNSQRKIALGGVIRLTTPYVSAGIPSNGRHTQIPGKCVQQAGTTDCVDQPGSFPAFVPLECGNLEASCSAWMSIYLASA